MSIRNLETGSAENRRHRVLIFNPDTDFALGSGSDFYTPPKAAISQAIQMPLTASRWGKPGDSILIPYPFPSEWLDDAKRDAFDSGFRLTTVDELASSSPISRQNFWDKTVEILPWGWNPSLLHRLLCLEAPERLLPSRDFLELIRRLADRRFTKDFNRALNRFLPVDIPLEFTSEQEALSFLDSNPGCWFKLPWSSSGRGVVNTAVNSRERIAEWIRGGIRRQGAVMGETGAERMLDFASEWVIKDTEARFLGLSLFRVSSRGQYLGNELLSQTQIRETIGKVARFNLEEIVGWQKEVIESLPLREYQGPLGIDMIVERNGNIRPCVEINLRRTMGMLRL